MADRKRRKKQRRVAAAQAEMASRADAPRRAMRVLVIVYLFVAASYATSIPLGKGPDETAHVRYIEFLAREHRLPVFDAAHPDPNYEFHQPPLYYVACLPAYLLARGGEAGEHAARFLTLLLSLPLIYLTFALGRRLAPDDAWVAVAAAGVVAFLPAQLSVATTVGNDALTEVLSAAVVVVLVGYLGAAAPSARAMVAVGVLIGLGMLTKSIAVLLLPVAWLAALFGARTDGGVRWRQALVHAATATVVALVICGWWLVRNQVLYGDPLAQGAFLRAFAGLRPSPQSFMEQYHLTSVGSYVGQVIIWTTASATGVFGPVHGNRFAFFPYYMYFTTGLIAAAAALGFARYLGRTKLADWQRRSWWLSGAFALLLLGSFVRFNLSFFQAQARYLFPALPAAAVAFSIGLAALFPVGWRRAILMAATALLAAIAFVGLYLWIAPQFITSR
jgi:4-amino-4-deoxy-L-arabinose transferase-like glycosyltransferase